MGRLSVADERQTAKPGAGEKVTPMMAQYLEQKAKAGDVLLFYRMGDFYELFFDDAVKAAEALDIALTKRGKHLGEDIPMCGVPAATAEAYLRRLIEQGFRVAVCEQTEDPAEAKKRGAKSVVRREVVRTVTPGTITEDALLDARAAAYIAAVAPQKDGAVGLAWADVSTGVFVVTTTDQPGASDVLAGLDVREVLAPEDWGAGPVSMDRLTPLAGAMFHVRSGARRLKETFGVDTLEGFGAFTDAEFAAAGALVDYLTLTQAGEALRLAPPRREAAAGVMAIDPATRASLELDRTLSGAKRGSLREAVDRTVTAPGARLAADRLARPLTDAGAISARHDAAGFFADRWAVAEGVRADLKAAGDPERSMSRLLLGRGGPRDLHHLAAALTAGAAAGTRVRKGDALSAAPAEIAAALDDVAITAHADLAQLVADISASLVDSPPVAARDGGFIAAGVDADLDAARALRDDSRRVIAGLEGQYRDQTGVAGLKIKHNGVLGYFIEVSAKAADTLHDAPAMFIHRQTMANAVRFSTSELAGLQAEIAAAGERALSRELAMFEAFVARVEALSPAIRRAAWGLAVLDVAAGVAAWARDVNAVRPTIEPGGAFVIEAGRHPVVEAGVKRDGGAFTPNDCTLDADGAAGPRLTLVTGPNMAGKSTYLRQNALFAILAQSGWFVPAASARIGVVTQVFSRVGAGDDIARGRSTFMAEMVETAAILNQAGPGALVILDEIGRGTATYDGLAIAWATAEHLHDVNGCRALFATHYHELTALADDMPQAANVCLKAKEWKGDLVFLHEVGPGAADRSYGVEVAKRAGLPKKAVGRAKAVLKELEAGGKSKADVLPLFAVAAEPDVEPLSDETSAVLDALADVDPDALSPREALDLAYRLKALADKAGAA